MDEENELLAAVAGGHEQLARELLSRGVRPRASLLRSAARVGNVEILEMLVSETGLPEKDSGDALVSAALFAHDNIVAYLCRKGVEVNYVGDHGESALRLATLHGRRRVVDQLLAFDVDVNAMNPHNGRTALHIAVLGKHWNIAHALLEHGAKAHLVDAKGRAADEYDFQGLMSEDLKQLLKEAKRNVGKTVKSAKSGPGGASSAKSVPGG